MWAYNETFYQIYPIGFCGAPTHNDGIWRSAYSKIKRLERLFGTAADRVCHFKSNL